MKLFAQALLALTLVVPAAAADTEPPLTPKEKIIKALFERQKGTRDLAGTAELIKAADSKDRFIWSADNDGDLPKATTVRDLWNARKMACYEFVHYAAYFAGDHPTREVFDTVPQGLPEELAEKYPDVADPAEMRRVTADELRKRGYPSRAAVVISIVDYGVVKKGTKKVWDGKSEIPRGKVILGVARAYNNTAGYFHTGISLGGGQVISLRGEKNLAIEPIGDVFGSWGYSEIDFGDYDYGAQPKGE